MPKTNANDMIMAWLDMKIHENPDSFDAINAENCLALIRKQRKQLIRLGAHFCNLKKQRDKLRKELDTRISLEYMVTANKRASESVPWWVDKPYGWLMPTCCETKIECSTSTDKAGTDEGKS